MSSSDSAAHQRPSSPGPLRLLDQVRQRIRYRHYSLRTEQAYLLWIKAYIRHHGMRHPSQMAAAEVESFLNHLVNTRRISPSTHKQALCALLFLYREVLGANLPWMTEIQRPVVRKRIPTVLTPQQVQSLLARMEGEAAVVCKVLYGCGLRLAEALALRVNDLDFERNLITVRSGKGGKDRLVMLPVSVMPDLWMCCDLPQRRSRRRSMRLPSPSLRLSVTHPCLPPARVRGAIRVATPSPAKISS